MSYYGNVLELVGKTPMVELKRFDTGPCRLFVKLEFMNPGGSIKDRIAISMIEAAEQAGQIKPGDTLIEATAGNTGLGLALVAAQKGYKLIIVMPDKMSQEKVFNLKALGAQVLMTRSDVVKGHPEYYQDIAERLAKENGYYYINQFGNAANVKAHEEGTGPEIWEQMEGQVDAVVIGVGSGGTITGIARALKSRKPDIKVVLADPKGSILRDLIKTGRHDAPGSWLVEGIGEDFVPPICDLSLVDDAVTIPDDRAFEVARELLLKEGLMAGSSSGTLLGAALEYCRQQTKPMNVVTLLPDTGNKYLSKMYNDYWMMEQGFISRDRFGDLRDLIARPHEEKATITVGPKDSLATAYKRMKQHEVSQLPVLDDGHCVGMLDEYDVLVAVSKDRARFEDSVETAMSRSVETVPYTASIESLMPLFERSFVPVIVDGERFLGVITKMDVLNHLRRAQ
ncbi:MAG: cystathionine beta-synthase [Gammaproteobacteria bacterium]|nr:cystathionine beta-synthase [Gammaproteobacteria bacterium]